MERIKDKKLDHHIRRCIKQIIEVEGRKKKEVEIEGREGERKGDMEGRDNKRRKKQNNSKISLNMSTEIWPRLGYNATFLCWKASVGDTQKETEKEKQVTYKESGSETLESRLP